MPVRGWPVDHRGRTLSGMIDEVDEALRRLLRGGGIGDVEITFDAGPASNGSPSVELRLEDVTEDISVRHACWEDVHEDGRLRWRRPPMRWFRLTYEVSARAVGAEAEHRLLSTVLRCLVVHDQLPPQCLVGSLRELEATVLVTVAAPRAERLMLRRTVRPSLAVVVTAPLQPAGIQEAPPPPQTSRLSVGRSGATADTVTSTPGDGAMHRSEPPPPTAPLRRGRRVTTSG